MLVDHGRARTFADGQTIFNEGDPGREMYVIQEGAVEISAMSQGGEITLDVLDKSDFFGEMSLLSGRPRSATARAVGDVEVLVIDKAQFEQLVDDPLVRMMLERMSDRIWKVDQLLKELGAQELVRREDSSGPERQSNDVV